MFSFVLTLVPVPFPLVYTFLHLQPAPFLATEKFEDSGGHVTPHILCIDIFRFSFVIRDMFFWFILYFKVIKIFIIDLCCWAN